MTAEYMLPAHMLKIGYAVYVLPIIPGLVRRHHLRNTDQGCA